MRVRLAVPLLTLALCLSAAPSATGQSNCVAPPGTSAIDQYCEVIPDGRGGNSVGGGASDNATGPGVPDRAAQQLRDAGPAGEAVLALAGAADAPGSAGGEKDGTASDGRSTSPLDDVQPSSASENPLQAVVRAAEDEARVGSGFIWLLLAAVAAMGAWGWVAFRRSGARG